MFDFSRATPVRRSSVTLLAVVNQDFPERPCERVVRQTRGDLILSFFLFCWHKMVCLRETGFVSAPSHWRRSLSPSEWREERERAHDRLRLPTTSPVTSAPPPKSTFLSAANCRDVCFCRLRRFAVQNIARSTFSRCCRLEVV